MKTRNVFIITFLLASVIKHIIATYYFDDFQFISYDWTAPQEAHEGDSLDRDLSSGSLSSVDVPRSHYCFIFEKKLHHF